jgi:hypothetical protein
MVMPENQLEVTDQFVRPTLERIDRSTIARVREESVFNLGRSGRVGAAALVEILKRGRGMRL